MSNVQIAKAKKALGNKKSEECIKVIVRVRPLFGEEIKNNMASIVDVDEGGGRVTVRNPNNVGAPKVFTFDQAYGPGDPLTIQQTIYNKTAAPLVENVIQGFNGTIFAYGQTGAGKSYTMDGGDQPATEGLMPRAFRHITEKIGLNKNKNLKFLIQASYLEIYNNEVYDLLGKNPKKALKLRQKSKSGVYLDGLTKIICTSVRDLMRVKVSGSRKRRKGKTNMNLESSRSHSIFTVIIETEEKNPADASKPKFRVGKLNLVDLAGSERQKKTQATGARLKEGNEINKSLMALGNVISALTSGKKKVFVPYRDSKLTRLLQDSLGGNTKTIMCANCGPADYNFDETVGTLWYANRAKNIKNKPKINEDPKDAMLREFQDEILKLKAQLAAQNKAAASGATVLSGDMMGGESSESETESEEESEEELVEAEPVIETRHIAGVDDKDVAHSKSLHEAEKKILERKKAIEKKKLEKEKKKQEKKQAKLKAQLEAQEKARQLAMKAKRETQERLRLLQGKMVSTTPLVNKAAAQEREHARLQAELEERQRRNRAIEEEKKRQEQAFDVMKEDFQSLQEEATVKGRNLKKAFAAYQAQKQETEDLQKQFANELEDELEVIRTQTKELKLFQLLVSQFIPEHHLKNIEARAKWNEELGEWNVAHMKKYAGNSKIQRERARKNAPPPCTLVRKHMPDGKHSDFYRRNVYMSREDNVYVPVFTNPFYKYDSRSDSYLSLVGDMQETTLKESESDKRKKKSKKESRGKSKSSKSKSSSRRDRRDKKDKKDKKKKSKKRHKEKNICSS